MARALSDSEYFRFFLGMQPEKRGTISISGHAGSTNGGRSYFSKFTALCNLSMDFMCLSHHPFMPVGTIPRIRYLLLKTNKSKARIVITVAAANIPLIQNSPIRIFRETGTTSLTKRED